MPFNRFFIFIIVTLLYWITLYIYVPILSPYLESRGLSYSLVGIILGSYGFVQIIIRLPLGIYSDRIRKRKPFLAIGLATGALSCLLFAISNQWGWTLAARAVSGISASCWVAFTVLFASYYNKNEATRAMGYISTLTVCGQLIGMGLSGWLADKWGWNATFWAGTLIGLLGLAATFAIKEPKEGTSRIPIQVKDLFSVMHNASLVKVSILAILAHCVLFITMFGFTPSQAVSLGATKSELSMLVFAFMIPHAAAAYITSKWIVPRIGAWNAIMIGFTFSSICTIAVSLLPSFGWLAASQAFNGFAQGMHIPLLLGLAIQRIEPLKRASAMGFYQSAYSIGMFAGPFIAGWLNQSYGLTSGFYLGGAFGLTAAMLTIVWSRADKQSRHTVTESF
ncbi:MAG: arabinose efflux permease family protein [Bacilli bacterium]|nr:arabinose efflux permease family protein [Bacilli bacterium]